MTRKNIGVVALVAVAVALVIVMAWLSAARVKTGGEGDPMGEEFVADWESPENPSIHITILDSGAFQGNDSCNRFSGSYAIDGETLVVKRRTSTMRGCVNADPWLKDLASAQVVDGKLIAFDRDGIEIGYLVQKK